MQNLDYHWDQAKIKTLNDKTLAIAVPVSSIHEEQEYIGEKMLYLYPQNGGQFKAYIFKIDPDQKMQHSKDDTAVDLINFNGCISVWDLKKGYIKGALFKNNKITQNLSLIIDLKEKNQVNNLVTTPTELDEVLITSGGGGGSGGSIFFFPTASSSGISYGGMSSGGYFDPPSYGGGSDGGSDLSFDTIEEQIDPCSAGVTTSTISKDKEYLSATESILIAASDGFEHSVTLGKNTDGKITQAPMNSGNQQYKVSTNYSWPGAFGAIHNHPNPTPLSAGDIYASLQLNEKSSSFTTSVILTGGEVYAIVVNNLALAQAFVKNYPADQIPGYSPEFPDIIFNQLQVLVTPMGSTIEGRTQAIAFVLDKYNAGITLLKQNSNGEFNPIKTQETTQSDGTKTYTKIPCN